MNSNTTVDYTAVHSDVERHVFHTKNAFVSGKFTILKLLFCLLFECVFAVSLDIFYQDILLYVIKQIHPGILSQF